MPWGCGISLGPVERWPLPAWGPEQKGLWQLYDFIDSDADIGHRDTRKPEIQTWKGILMVPVPTASQMSFQ